VGQCVPPVSGAGATLNKTAKTAVLTLEFGVARILVFPRGKNA
jgi:hypothetical protein